MNDQQLLEAVNWTGLHRTLIILAIVFGFIAAVFGTAHKLLPNFAWFKYERQQRDALALEGIRDKVWLMNEPQLIKSEFEKVELEDDLALFYRVPPFATDKLPVVEAVIKDGLETVGFAEIMALDHKVSWTYGSSETVRYQDEDTPLSDYLKDSSIPKHLAERSQDPLDIIAIGIMSTIKRPPNTTFAPAPKATTEGPTLSTKRALSLGATFRESADFVKTRKVAYWTLDLGAGKTATEKDSDLEKKQRAAILVALTRRAQIDRPLSAEQAMALITTNVKVYETDLTDFAYSGRPAGHFAPLP